MSDELKPWRCEKRHVMGQVRRNGSGVRQLMLYRQAVGCERLDDLVEVDVIAVVEGYVAEVRCSICGSVRTWIPGQEALDRLLEQMQRQSAS